MTDSPEHWTYGYVRDRAPLIFMICGCDGEIIQANTYAESITGGGLAEKNIKDLIVDFNDRFDLDRLKQDAAREHLFNIETANGLPQSFYFRFQPMGNKVLVYGRLDADELELMRRELLSLNQDLNSMTRRLHKQKAQLAQLNTEKNQFLGMAAHDLRKPIGLILTYSEFLIDEAADDMNAEHRDFLNTIHRSCASMQRLVDDFLDISAIEAGRFDLHRQPTTMQSVLEACLKLIHLKADQKRIKVDIRTDEALPVMDLDGPKIEQVLLNLAANAIEHTESGGSIWIDLSHIPDGVAFSVKDQGPGIAVEELGTLFKSFGRTGAPKSGGEPGTGLGLAISRKIVEAHLGEIGVDSQPGGGTTFTVKLPTKG